MCVSVNLFIRSLLCSALLVARSRSRSRSLSLWIRTDDKPTYLPIYLPTHATCSETLRSKVKQSIVSGWVSPKKLLIP